MHMAERQWADAAMDFFEAFKNYDEAGTHRRIQCLKLVFINTLASYFVICMIYKFLQSPVCYCWVSVGILEVNHKVM